MFLTIFSASVLSADFIQKNIINPFYDESVLTNESTLQKENNYQYNISVFNGKIAVFEKDSKLPYKVYDTYISSLPYEDQKLLTDGIKVNSASEVMKIIEEYTS